MEGANSREAIELAIAGHEKRTDTTVTADIELPEQALSEEMKVCLYRFIQEGLNNSFRHADAAEQEVEGERDPNRISFSRSMIAVPASQSSMNWLMATALD